MVDAVGTTHHVKIGDIFCTLVPGGYRRRFAPLRGARVSSGDPSYNDLSVWQVWNQHCWAGGLGADLWEDDSMFSEAVGVDTTQHEQMSLSRDLTLTVTGGLDVGAIGEAGEFRVYKKPNGNKRLYFLTTPDADISSGLWKYRQNENDWQKVKSFGGPATCMVSHSGELAVGLKSGKIKAAANPDTNTWRNRNPPKGETAGVTAMMRYRQRLYVAYGRTVYRRKWNWKIDGKTEFYDPQGGGDITSMEQHLGFLYMGSRGGHIHRTDGNQSFDLWSWDGGTEVVSLRSFDGRLFIGTYEFNDDKTLGIGGLYHMTGSAVTRLKRWGELNRSTIMGKMGEYDRRLYYGASGLWSMNKNAAGTDLGGFGVATYDPIEDAHSVWASNKDIVTYPDTSGTGADHIVDDIIYYRGRMFAFVRGYGVFWIEKTYRDYVQGTVDYDTTTTAATGSANNGFLVSSVYDGGTPGLLKLWRFGQVEAYLPTTNVSAELQYSTDKGDSWTSLGTISRVLTGTFGVTSGSGMVVGTAGTQFTTELAVGDQFTLNSVVHTVFRIDSDTSLSVGRKVSGTYTGTATGSRPDVRRKFYMSGTDSEVVAVRMQYRIVLNSSNSAQTPTIRSVSFWYLPEPEPNWVWDLTVVIAERVEKLDGVDDTQDIETALETIRQYGRSQKIIEFIDREGNTWDALLWDFVEDYHVPGKASEPKEGYLRLSVLEVNDS